MAKLSVAMVKCKYCGISFDRNKYVFCKPASNRYAHPECAKEYALVHNLPEPEVFDPSVSPICRFCRKPVNIQKEGIQDNGGNWVHKVCKEYDDNREKTDADRLNDYIISLFGGEYINQNIQKQITNFVENGYTHSGIMKSLQYFYEVENGDIRKSNGGINIVPYIYEKAKKYYYQIWLAEQVNSAVQVKPMDEIKVKLRTRKSASKRNNNFNFLDEEE